MNNEPATAGEKLPAARIRKRKWTFPFVWIVPVIAAVVAGYLVYHRLREVGPTITIRFRDAAGLKPGQTPVLYRGVHVGEVSDISLSKDQHYAEVKVSLRRSAASIAREGSTFWIVRPRLDAGTITGLGTIITGPHISVTPGAGPAEKKHFVGSETSPTTVDPRGLKIVLMSGEGGSLRAGVPIYYRGIEVGTVQETVLSTNARTVEIHAIVQQRYAPLVRPESKFWNVTGIDVRFGLFRGAEINVESLKSLIIGGIAFATPEDPQHRPAANGAIFRLYDQPEKAWLQWSPSIMIGPEESPDVSIEPTVVSPLEPQIQ